MTKKYYAVVNRNTRFNKITKDYREFDKLVRDSDCFGKGFKKRSKAVNFINQKLKLTPHIGSLEKENDIHKLKLNNNELVIYTDASFIDNKSPYSIANIYLSKEKGCEEFSKKITFPAKNSTNAEEIAIIYALGYALKKGFKDVYIYTDCLNTINEISKKEDFYYDYKRKLNFSIYHVKAHDGNFYNERCDILARKALKEESNKKKTEETITISKKTYDDLVNILEKNINLIEKLITGKKYLEELKFLYKIEDDIKNI